MYLTVVIFSVYLLCKLFSIKIGERDECFGKKSKDFHPHNPFYQL